MGVRYGGLKQIDPVGPGGETIIDYSIYDALRAGFGKLVFVIRPDIEAAFRQAIGRKFEDKLAVEYAYQELDRLPAGFTVAPNRQRPWGTGHAILAAEGKIDGAFVAINADDFYGAASFKMLGDYLTQEPAAPETGPHSGPANYAMAGFVLRNTLSEFGSVARGVCWCDAQNFLQHVIEFKQIEKNGSRAKYTDQVGQSHLLSGDEIVSMNMWGFRPLIFEQLRDQFVRFLQTHGHEEKAEFFIPTVVNNLVSQGQARIKILSSPDSWFGVTYQADKPQVVKNIQRLVARGVYPERLWP